MRSSPPYRVSGFTLVEMLAVLAVVAILAGISFGLISGVQSSQARSRAAAELSALATGLESYRSRYGTYPVTDSPQEFFRAMENRFVPVRDGSGGLNWEIKGNPQGRAFVDLDLFSKGSGPVFNDPWGRPYIYSFRSQWQQEVGGRYGFLLYSRGPSGNHQPRHFITGYLDREAEENLDNIYAD